MHHWEHKPKRIKWDDAVLVVVDLQERLVPAMREGEKVSGQAVKAIRGFRALGCPVLVTQQYTKGLGETVAAVQEAFDGDFSYIEKSAFSVMAEPAFKDALAKTGRKTVLLQGIEAHVCVLQSALDMIEDGYEVFLVVDAISSRKEADETPGVQRMIHSRVLPTTVESALFELLDNDSKSDTFKAISKLIK
jgi:nicotinamidase-related amidase